MTILNRRTFLRRTAAATAALSMRPGPGFAEPAPPNVIMILTDDQGYGDIGAHGNPILKTPHLDALCRDGAHLTNFHSSPVCSPTRACLMTGRYNYRTGVVDTFQGRSLMYPDEVTIAERLAEHGYRTGIFGKWHLGDNYPLRAHDQGFQVSLVHKGGGLCQPSEPENVSYFDPLLMKNGTQIKAKGYCTDVFTDAAIEFVHSNAAQPFFLYLATNTPHDPPQVEDRFWKPYADQGLDERTAKIYGMIANLDENVGRLLNALETQGIAQNTLVVFMTDNGPAFGGKERYNAGLRDQKGSVYEGGIRVPCFIRWPKAIAPGTTIDTLAAHIDLFPTFLNACGFETPPTPKLDGRSLLPLLQQKATEWPNRTLFFQWHRGDAPEPFKNAAAINQQYKLVNGTELYDLLADPAEKFDRAPDHPEIVDQLRNAYESWFADVSATRGYSPPRIVLGAPNENPAILTRQDWRGAQSWHDDQSGWWEVRIAQAGEFRVTADFSKYADAKEAVFRLNGVTLTQTLTTNTRQVEFPPVHIPEGEGRLEVWRTMADHPAGPQRVRIERL